MSGINRRRFLAGCAGTGIAGALAAGPTAFWPDLVLAANERPLKSGSRILVLVTMHGGNDGLNTVIPYSRSAYHAARPGLAYGGSEVITLDSDYGLNPGMTGMAELFKTGELAIIRGVGYPDPDRSHFRSMDIWQTASLNNEEETGWLGRWLDASKADPLRALHIGQVLPRLVIGHSSRAAVCSDGSFLSPDSLKLIEALSQHESSDNEAMTKVCDSYRDSLSVNEGLRVLAEQPQTRRSQSRRNGNLSSQLHTVADCINANVPTQVYSTTIGGFDTHADERQSQETLLAELDNSLTSFLDQIDHGTHGKDVVIVAYSEFGRRVRANASDGTDHGTSGPVFVLGAAVQGGYYGDDPSLTDLKNDDLKVTTDFRDIYSEILLNVLDSDPEPIVGDKRSHLKFLKA